MFQRCRVLTYLLPTVSPALSHRPRESMAHQAAAEVSARAILYPKGKREQWIKGKKTERRQKRTKHSQELNQGKSKLNATSQK